MNDHDTMAAIERALTHLDESLEVIEDLKDTAYALAAMPLGAINPAAEAAIATARFVAELDSYTVFRAKLRKALGDAT